MGKIYAVSDLHGCKHLYEKIKDYIQPGDRVYCLGDAGDRGPYPWETLKLILDDLQFEYILGNHDQMLLHVMEGALEENKWKRHSALQLLRANGGEGTYRGWMEESDEDRLKYYNLLCKTALSWALTNAKGQDVHLSHAGATPGIDWEWQEEELLWSRSHFADAWPAGYEDVYIVHGHTPIDYFGVTDSVEWKMYTYADGHKMDIDTGAKWSGVACLLDLDTFEPIYFKAD